MRGVEAGMGMTNINGRKTGKLLNTQRLRQQRTERRSPYGSSSRGEQFKSACTDENWGDSSKRQAASAIRESVGLVGISHLPAFERTPVGRET